MENDYRTMVLVMEAGGFLYTTTLEAAPEMQWLSFSVGAPIAAPGRWIAGAPITMGLTNSEKGNEYIWHIPYRKRLNHLQRFVARLFRIN